MLFNGGSLVLATAVAVVLERDALLLDVVYKLYATVLHRNVGGNELVGGCRTLVHRAWNVGRAGADALIVGHRGEECVEVLLLQCGSC